MVGGHHNKATILKGHSIRKIENHCSKDHGSLKADCQASVSWIVLGNNPSKNGYGILSFNRALSLHSSWKNILTILQGDIVASSLSYIPEHSIETKQHVKGEQTS